MVDAADGGAPEAQPAGNLPADRGAGLVRDPLPQPSPTDGALAVPEAVRAALAPLARLDDLPVAEHPARFEAAQRDLDAVLGSSLTGDGERR